MHSTIGYFIALIVSVFSIFQHFMTTNYLNRDCTAITGSLICSATPWGVTSIMLLLLIILSALLYVYLFLKPEFNILLSISVPLTVLSFMSTFVVLAYGASVTDITVGTLEISRSIMWLLVVLSLMGGITWTKRKPMHE